MPIAASVSKRQVNRAGAFLRDFRIAYQADAEAWKTFGLSQIEEAIAVVDSWRALHTSQWVG